MTEFGEKIYEILTCMGNAECETAAVIEAFRARAHECARYCDSEWEDHFTEMAEALEDARCEIKKRKHGVKCENIRDDRRGRIDASS